MIATNADTPACVCFPPTTREVFTIAMNGICGALHVSEMHRRLHGSVDDRKWSKNVNE
jgi:hypothetical protein